LPIIGTIFAIKGAVSNWGWAILPSIVFFAAPYIIIGILSLVDAIGKKNEK
jgi:uncharacterized membrane protein